MNVVIDFGYSLALAKPNNNNITHGLGARNNRKHVHSAQGREGRRPLFFLLLYEDGLIKIQMIKSAFINLYYI